MVKQVTRKGMSLAVEVRHAMHALPGAGRPAYDPAQADYAPQLLSDPEYAVVRRGDGTLRLHRTTYTHSFCPSEERVGVLSCLTCITARTHTHTAGSADSLLW